MQAYIVYGCTVGIEMVIMVMFYLGVRKCKKINFMPFRQLDNLVVGSQFVAFVERVGEAGENNQYLHLEQLCLYAFSEALAVVGEVCVF